MKFFRYPKLLNNRDVLTVICDKCDLIASQFVNDVPLCPDHAAEQSVEPTVPSVSGSARDRQAVYNESLKKK